MHISDFTYDLPPELIAQQPLPDRDRCRLLRLSRTTGVREHWRFSDLPRLLRPGDLLVLNDSRVIPARLNGRKSTGGRAEVLLVRKHDESSWFALTRPGLSISGRVSFDEGLDATVESISVDQTRLMRFNRGGEDLNAIVHRIGTMPIPPYIRSQPANPEDYQTVYAREEGSIAAPTAGLHFTTALLHELSFAGIDATYLRLHVGIGTFRPVKVDDVSRHQMHAETYAVGDETAQAVNAARLSGRRVIAVGTTVVRVLESIADERGLIQATAGETALFIVPGYQFRCIDALITNFHLPRSTLLMLISAFAGREPTLAAYRDAVARSYRFFSFGDAMLID